MSRERAQIVLRLPVEMLDTLDELRGMTHRNTWIVGAIELRLEAIGVNLDALAGAAKDSGMGGRQGAPRAPGAPAGQAAPNASERRQAWRRNRLGRPRKETK